MTSPQDDLLLRLAARISDGESVDWEEIESSGLSGEDLALARELRIVADIADSRREVPLEAPPSGHAAEEGGGPDLQRWGHLITHRRIAGGANGDVYVAWDPQLEREVALKLLRPKDGDVRRQTELLKEARLLARINDPNVATVHGAAFSEGRVGLWMEYVKGRTLEEMVLEQGPFGASEAVLIGMEVCRAAAVVHKAGVVHRDIKAQNVIRAEGGRIVLTDFGSGYVMPSAREMREEGPIRGTPLYMAPEVLEGSEPTPHSDIYSIGVLLYFLMTGTFPVRGVDLAQLRRSHREGRRQRLSEERPELPYSVCQVVEKALRPSPRRRFVSAREMEEALAAALTDPQIQKPAAGPGVGAVPKGLLAAAAAVLLTALLLYVGIDGFLTSTPEAEPLKVLLGEVQGPADAPHLVSQMRAPLVASLQSASLTDLVGEEELELALRRMRRSPGEAVEPAIARRLLRRGLADVAVIGKLGRDASGYRMSLRVAGPSVANLAFLPAAVQRDEKLGRRAQALADHLLRRLRDLGPSLPPRPPPAAVTTSSEEALKYYRQGLDLLRSEEFQQAADKFQAALDSDPRFALAYVRLSRAQGSIGQSLLALESIQRAHQLEESVTPREAAEIDVTFLHMTGRHERAEQAASNAIARFPDERYFYRLRVRDRVRLHRLPEAIEDVARANRLEYRPLDHAFQAFLTAENGYPEQALEMLERLRKPLDEGYYLDWTRGFAYLQMFKFPQAERSFRRMLEANSYFWNSQGRHNLAQLALLRGRFLEALKLLEENAPLGPKADFDYVASMRDLWLARLHFLRGEDDLARKALGRVLREPYPPILHFVLRDAVWIVSRARAWEEAEPFITKLEALHERFPGSQSKAYREQVKGEGLRRQGRLEGALDKLSLARSSLDDIVSIWNLAAIHEDRREYVNAAALYELIFERKGRVLRWLPADLLAVSLQSAARCWKKAGQEAKASQALERLDSFWDPDEFGQQLLESSR